MYSLIFAVQGISAAQSESEGAQNTKSEEVVAQKEVPSTETAAETAEKKEQEKPAQPGVFRPSEEISEDVSIAFPVDI